MKENDNWNWSKSRLSHRPSKPAYYIVDRQICRVGARPNQKMDGGYIQCEFPRTLVPIQHSEMSVI